MLAKRDLYRELDEVSSRLTKRHNVKCARTTDENGRDVLEFVLSHGKYMLVIEKVRESILVYCEENYSTKGYEYLGATTTANGVCFKLGIW